ncbi:glycosyltransferase family 4 protein [Candidatus Parcubacteria bacterium]|nr:glycosyltransferase family 4 protein [Candidatus Parcubacteria bacterium]
MSSIKRKIGIDARVLMNGNFSGIPEFTLELLENLFKIDSVNEYVLFYNSYFEISNVINDLANKYHNVAICQSKVPNKIYNYFNQKLFKYPKIDVASGVDFFYMPNINFASLSQKSKKIITVHDLSFLRYPEFFSLRNHCYYKMINVKKFLKNFDKIIAVSENTKDDIVDLCGISEEIIEVIYSGVNENYKIIDKCDFKLKSIKDKYKLADNIILYLGTIEPRKNIDGIIQAFDLLMKNIEFKDYQLILAGGSGWKNKEIYKIWKKSKNKDKIKFLGFVPNEDKIYLYNSASLFVYPSFYEGFGFPPLEALTCGIPVVTSNISSLPEILQKTATLINPYNIPELSRAMGLILKNKQTNENAIMISNQVKSVYNWQKTAEKYLKVFNN